MVPVVVTALARVARPLATLVAEALGLALPVDRVTFPLAFIVGARLGGRLGGETAVVMIPSRIGLDGVQSPSYLLA